MVKFLKFVIHSHDDIMADDVSSFILGRPNPYLGGTTIPLDTLNVAAICFCGIPG